MDITQLLAFSVKNKASDLHLSAGLPPMIRVHGDVRRINVDPLDHKQVHAMTYDIMNDAQRKQLEETWECDFSFAVPNLARFRVNAFQQNRGAGAVFRTIPSKVLTLEELNCPKIFKEIAHQPRGIVLVTGPTGSGKSTTLAAMLDYVNENEYGHILTVEDPIEFVHESKRCLVNQREVHRDTMSFNNALRAALRGLDNAERQVYAAALSRELADRNLDIDHRRFLTGVQGVDNFKLAQRQSEQSSARLQELRALLQHERAQTQLLLAMGELLESRQLKFELATKASQ